MNKLGVEERGIGAIIFVGERDGPAWAVRVPVLPGVTETLLNSTNLNYQTKGHHRGKLIRIRHFSYGDGEGSKQWKGGPSHEWTPRPRILKSTAKEQRAVGQKNADDVGVRA